MSVPRLGITTVNLLLLLNEHQTLSAYHVRRLRVLPSPAPEKQKAPQSPSKTTNHGARAINERKKTKTKKPLTSPRSPISRGKQQSMPPCQQTPHRPPRINTQPPISSHPRCLGTLEAKTPGAPPDRLNFQHACRNIDAKRKKNFPLEPISQPCAGASLHWPVSQCPKYTSRAQIPQISSVDPGRKKGTRPRFTGLKKTSFSGGKEKKKTKNLDSLVPPPLLDAGCCQGKPHFNK